MEYNDRLLSESLRYLGVRGQPPSELSAQVEEALTRLLPLCSPRWVWRAEDKEQLPTMGLELPGQDIHTLLRDCRRVVLFALTLGQEADLLIRREGLRSPATSLILDACASAVCEQACDRLQAQLEEQLCADGLFATDRFSPGYGDLPLSVQIPLLELLDAQRRCGITLSPALLMTPRKSVTAIFGLADRPQGKRARGCAFCSMRKNCSYRKAGITCGS